MKLNADDPFEKSPPLFLFLAWAQLIDTETVDLGGVRWSPDGGKVAVWDSVHAGRWSVYSMAGALLGRQESAGDIHDVQWNPSAQLLAVAQSGSKVSPGQRSARGFFFFTEFRAFLPSFTELVRWSFPPSMSYQVVCSF